MAKVVQVKNCQEMRPIRKFYAQRKKAHIMLCIRFLVTAPTNHLLLSKIEILHSRTEFAKFFSHEIDRLPLIDQAVVRFVARAPSNHDFNIIIFSIQSPNK
jgi:hypothetical protein